MKRLLNLPENLKPYKTPIVCLIISVSLLMPMATVSQEQLMIPADLLKKANTAKDASYLSYKEKQVIMYMNIARLDGEWFIENIIDKKNLINSKYLKSLRRDLEKAKGLSAMKPCRNLTKSARFHAKDMGKSGKTGHESSDGTGTFKRIKKFAKGNSMAENCSYGVSSPLSIVLQLLIDEGVQSVGHRKNMLSRSYKYIGTAIEPHKSYRYNCVQDFSDQGSE